MLDIQQELEKYRILDSEGNLIYDNKQMYQIQIGLESGIDVSIFAKPEYDWIQMAQIRLGLEDGINVSQYAILNTEGKPVYDFMQMHEIRKKLENTKTVQVHPDLFHEDDILCIAMLMKVYGEDNINIIRDTKIHPEADYVLDVGQENYIEYKIGKDVKKATLEEFKKIYNDSVKIVSVHLDHHPVSEKDRNYRADDPYQIHSIDTIKDNDIDTGILHCGASLLYDFMHEYNIIDDNGYQDFKNIIIKPVAAKDNGMKLPDADLLSYVTSYNPVLGEDYSIEAVKDIAVMVMNHIKEPIETLKNEYLRMKKNIERKEAIKAAQIKGKSIIYEVIQNKNNAPYIILPDGALFKDARDAAVNKNASLKEENKSAGVKDLICFEIHKDTARNQYAVVCIPPDKEHQMEQLITIPEDVLQNKDCVFRHRTGFMAAFKTLDAAKNVAEELYNEQIKIHEVLTTFEQAYDIDTSGTNISEYIIFDSDSNLLYENCQLYEICKGLKAGVDVSQFTILNSEGKPVFEVGQMYEIRKGLEANADVSKYTGLDSEGKPVYNWEQMREIRKQLEEELKIQKNTSIPKEDEEISL